MVRQSEQFEVNIGPVEDGWVEKREQKEDEPIFDIDEFDKALDEESKPTGFLHLRQSKQREIKGSLHLKKMKSSQCASRKTLQQQEEEEEEQSSPNQLAGGYQMLTKDETQDVMKSPNFASNHGLRGLGMRMQMQQSTFQSTGM